MDGDQLKQRLWDLGHFRNPEMPTGVETLDDALKLPLTSAEMKTAVHSYQDYLRADLDHFSLEEHGRLATADGDLGPATERLFSLPRCGFPDYPVPGLALAATKLESNWPTACRGKLKFGYNFANAPGLSAEDTRRAFVGAVNNWNYALSDMTLTVQDGTKGADIWAGLKRLAGSTLAWSYLAQDTCNTRLEQRYDSGRRWELDYLLTVATHELGHALGFSHNRDGSALMYPSIHRHSLARRGYPNSTDLSVARSNGYTLSGTEPPALDDLYRPMPHDPAPPPPGPQPPDGGMRFVGEFELFEGNSSRGKFIIIPKPEV